MKIKLALLAIAVLVLSAFAPQFSQSANAIICRFEATPCVTSWNGNDIYLYSDSGTTQKVLLEGSAGSMTMAGSLIIQGQTGITVTDGSVITPTGSFQPITAAGTVGATLGGCSSTNNGQVTRFVNTVNQTITITDTGNTVLAGNFAMGQYDALTTYCDGTRQIEVGRSNN